MDRYIGRILDGRYEILDIIGAGGMAVVYKARCHRLNRLVAIKILKDENLEDEDFCRRFHSESQAVAMLNHSNIVSVYDVSNTEEQDYIVMELIDGITLKQYMEKKVRLNWRETVHFATNIAKALEHAHSRGLVHRDIKPHNVMVLKNGSVKVADFGIARLMENETTMTKEALGSVHYISPEQAKGGRVDNRSDLYSLGVVMYEMITGKTPYDGDSPVAVALGHINGGAARPSSICPTIPKGLEQIIMKAMAHALPDRYINATAMLRDLEAFRADPTVTFSNMPESLEMVRRPNLHLHQPEQPMDIPQEKPRQQRQEVTWGTPRKTVSAEETVDDEENHGKGKTATIAVLICSVVAILAIIIFMILLTENDVNAQQPSVGDAHMTQRQTENGTLTVLTQSKQPVTTGKTVDTKTPTTNLVTTQIRQAQMKHLAGMTRQEAETVLTQLGFCNVQWAEQESLMPANTVIGQSVAPQTLIDVNTPITVVCAAGAVSRQCTFDMPFRTESYYLTILLDGRPVVAEQRMEPYRATATFQLTGKGTQKCEVYIDGELYYTVTVDFNAYAGN